MSTQEVSAPGIGDFPAALGPFRAAWDTSPASIIALSGPRHLLVYQNAASRALFGARPLGVPIEQAFGGVLPGTLVELDAVFATGEPVRRDRVRAGIRDLSGDEVDMRYSIAPYGPHGAQPDGVVVTGVDLSGEARAEVASHRDRLLARLTERINAAADPASALRALTEVLVPELADVAAVYVLPDDGESGTGGPRAEPVAPETVAVAAGLARLGPPPTPSVVREHPSRWDEVFASGIPVLVPFETGAQGEVAADRAARAWLAAAGTRNLAIVPLTVAGRLLGALLLVSVGDRKPFTEAILPFLTDVAARAGSAVVQVRQNRLQAEVSQQLQQALLPAAPPRIPGLRVAARYVAGAPEVDVGGDWWDVVRVDERHVSIGVGDVSGRGVEAAIVMGQARAAMRTAGLAGLGPAQVLGLLDRQVRDVVEDDAGSGEGPQFATALHAVVELDTGRTRLASAGHPPPLVHRPGQGSRVAVVPPGPPLGLGGGHPETEFVLPEGGSLLLFTDGLVEDRSRDLDAGLGELAARLAEHAGPGVAGVLDRLLEGLGSGEAADDVAVVLVRRDG